MSGELPPVALQREKPWPWPCARWLQAHSSCGATGAYALLGDDCMGQTRMDRPPKTGAQIGRTEIVLSHEGRI